MNLRKTENCKFFNGMGLRKTENRKFFNGMGLRKTENRKLFDGMVLRSQYHRCTLAGVSGCDLYFQPIEQRCLIVADASTSLGHGKEFGAVDLSTRADGMNVPADAA